MDGQTDRFAMSILRVSVLPHDKNSWKFDEVLTETKMHSSF